MLKIVEEYELLAKRAGKRALEPTNKQRWMSPLVVACPYASTTHEERVVPVTPF